MASAIAAPRNGRGTLGVAWGADLFAVRVDNDVLLTEVEATRMGIRLAAQNSRIITLAFGTWAYYSSISSELEYWYFNSDRVFFAAAGTYPCLDWFKAVSFPGTLETVLTVAAIDASGALACNSGRGYDVDFTAYAPQPVHGSYQLGNQLAGLGGSSGATAVLAGLAALYVSLHPDASRTRVMTALISAASPTGGRSPIHGFGAPNALCLVGMLCAAWIEGPNLIQSSGTYQWTLKHTGGSGSFTYQWNDGSTSTSTSRHVIVSPGMSEYMFTVTATVRDTQTGRMFTIDVPVVVRDPYQCPTCF